MPADASGRPISNGRLSNRPVILEICPPAPKDYRSLKIHRWNRGGGKGSWRGDTRAEARRRTVSSVMAGIRRAPSQRGVPDRSPPSPDRPSREQQGHPEPAEAPSSKRGNVQGDFRRLKFLTWGNHTATNQFRDIRNIAPGRHPVPAGAGL